MENSTSTQKSTSSFSALVMNKQLWVNDDFSTSQSEPRIPPARTTWKDGIMHTWSPAMFATESVIKVGKIS